MLALIRLLVVLAFIVVLIRTKRLHLGIVMLAATVFTAALFSTIHADAAHWPALFILASCMGYSYEKSGSLIRPIIIHALFNASSVITVMVSNSN